MNRRFGEEMLARLTREGRGPESYLELLACIGHRPAMYLGETSLTALGHFLSGYAAASRIHGTPESEELDLSGLDKRFVRWLGECRGIGYGACGPLGDLCDRCGGDDAVALGRFFELLREFETEGR